MGLEGVTARKGPIQSCCLVGTSFYVTSCILCFIGVNYVYIMCKSQLDGIIISVIITFNVCHRLMPISH